MAAPAPRTTGAVPGLRLGPRARRRRAVQRPPRRRGQVGRFPRHDPGRVAAEIEVDNRIPVRSDTMARLEMQGLTGASAVAMTGGAADAKPLAKTASRRRSSPSRANPEPAGQRAEHLRQGRFRADPRRQVDGDSAAITDTMKNIDTFSKALATPPAGRRLMLGIGEIGRKIGPLAGRLEKLTDTADTLLERRRCGQGEEERQRSQRVHVVAGR